MIYKRYYKYIAVVLIFLFILFFFLLSVINFDQVQYHRQSQTIIDLCTSSDFNTGRISIDDTCEEDKLPKKPFNLTIAFLSSQSSTESTKKVLKRIKDEKVDAIIHQGNFGHAISPQEWENQMNEILGSEFPIFAAMGNHDYYHWEEYYKILQNRLKRLAMKEKDFVCKGCLGVRSVCNYRGLWLYQTSDGIFNLRENELFIADNNPHQLPPSTRNLNPLSFDNLFFDKINNFNNNNNNKDNNNYDKNNKDDNNNNNNENLDNEKRMKRGEGGKYFEIDILKNELECAKSKKMTWKICSWNTYTYSSESFGGKNVADNFNACIDAGALIVNSHPHSYRKFYPLTSISSYNDYFAPNISKIVNGNQLVISHSSATPILHPGLSMQIVTGLEGDDKKNSYEPSAVDFGALICVFNPSSIIMKNEAVGILQELIVNSKDNIQLNFASCRFTAIDGRILDHFTIYLDE